MELGSAVRRASPPAPSARAVASIAVSVGSPTSSPSSSSSGVVAGRHRAGQVEQVWSRGWPAERRPRGRSPWPALQIPVTRMRFSVSVPVLSVQITSVEPSVSTALSRLTTAPRRARLATPPASARVITGSRPSGTLPTISPIARTSASANGEARAEGRERDEGESHHDRDPGDQPGDPANLSLQGALLLPRHAARARRSDPARCSSRSRRPAPVPRRRCRWCR